jgi:hypothetical protein
VALQILFRLDVPFFRSLAADNIVRVSRLSLYGEIDHEGLYRPSLNRVTDRPHNRCEQSFFTVIARA